MSTKFGTTVAMGRYDGDYGRAAEHCRFLEEVGFDTIWIGDEQSLRREAYVSMTVAALSTSRITLNVGPANPLTRHPAVTASAIATLDELSGGRAALTMSTGFSNVSNLGLRPAKLGTLQEYIEVVRGLWREHQATYRGKRVLLTWGKRVPSLYMVAEGPKALRLAGQIADGVVIGFGHTPAAAETARQYVREGAESAGRSLDDLDIWWHVRWAVDADHDAAVGSILAGLASAAGHVFPYGFEGRGVPEEFHEPIRQIVEQYVHSEHGSLDAPHVALLKDPNLIRYLASRFAIVGTAVEVIDQIQELASRGITQIRLGVGAPGADTRDRHLQAIATQIMPKVR